MKRKNSKSSARAYAILSPEDEDLRRWLVWIGICGHIAVIFPGSNEKLRLGPLIMQRMEVEIPPEHIVDHINRLPFDNRRENLRVVTKGQNQANNDALGVSFFKRDSNWRAYVNRNHRQIHLGYFSTKEEVLAARQKFLDQEGLVQ